MAVLSIFWSIAWQCFLFSDQLHGSAFYFLINCMAVLFFWSIAWQCFLFSDPYGIPPVRWHVSHKLFNLSGINNQQSTIAAIHLSWGSWCFRNATFETISFCKLSLHVLFFWPPLRHICFCEHVEGQIGSKRYGSSQASLLSHFLRQQKVHNV